MLKVCKGRSKRIGACADTGHWARSGMKPIECIKKLAGRIISFHFKDLNQMGMGTHDKPTHDVPWGTGVCDVKGMLMEIRRQKLKAVFSIEYEYHWDNSAARDCQMCRVLRSRGGPTGRDGSEYAGRPPSDGKTISCRA